MQIKLTLNDKKISIVLSKELEQLDKIMWIDKNDLLEKFFDNLEKILRDNKCDIDDISNFDLESNVSNKYTTARIAKTLIDTLRFASKM